MPRKKLPDYLLLKCKQCEIEFKSIKHNGRYRRTCSNRCAARLGNKNAKKVNINCKICSMEFSVAHFNIQEDGNYCSDKCRKQRILNNCVICTKEYRTDRHNTKYCSDECQKIGAKSKTVHISCSCCGETFERPSFTVASGKRYFCSKRCNARQFARENPNRYGSNWSRIRERKVKADNYTCNRCGKQTYEKYGLNVHHIIPIEEFDEPNDAHFEENLETLCFECHMDHHDKEILTLD